MTIDKKLTTVDEFEHFSDLPENRDWLFELIDGEIVEVSPTQEQGKVGGNLFGFLWNFNRQHGLGHVLMEANYRMPHDRHNESIPDVSFVAGLDTSLTKRGEITGQYKSGTARESCLLPRQWVADGVGHLP